MHVSNLASLAVANEASHFPAVAELGLRKLSNAVHRVRRAHLRIISQRQDTILNRLLLRLVLDDFASNFAHRTILNYVLNNVLCSHLLLFSFCTRNRFKLGEEFFEDIVSVFLNFPRPLNLLILTLDNLVVVLEELIFHERLLNHELLHGKHLLQLFCDRSLLLLDQVLFLSLLVGY